MEWNGGLTKAGNVEEVTASVSGNEECFTSSTCTKMSTFSLVTN